MEFSRKTLESARTDLEAILSDEPCILSISISPYDDEIVVKAGVEVNRNRIPRTIGEEKVPVHIQYTVLPASADELKSSRLLNWLKRIVSSLKRIFR